MATYKPHKLIKNWRGTRATYNLIAKAGTLDYWTRYSVKEVDGTWCEYYGSNLISEPSGQLLPVIDIVETLPAKLNPGDRYLVGSGSSYSIVTVDVDHLAENNLSTRSEAFTNNSGKSVRVINQKSMAYQLVDGELVTYDQVNGGTFN